MDFREENGVLFLDKEKSCIGCCHYRAMPGGAAIESICIEPAWRRRGYGSFLLKEVLRRTGGYAKNAASRHTVPPPADAGSTALYQKFGFTAAGECWARIRQPDMTAVTLAQQFCAAHCPAPAFCIDATCGNGGDTEFLCRLCAPYGGHVLAMDVQPEACRRTDARLAAAGFAPESYKIVCDSHARLMNYAAIESADLIFFNFGWLPGAQHAVFSSAQSSIPALEAALRLLRPGGVLSAVLYSGKTIGCSEKAALLAFFKALPLTQYTVLCCDFLNWGDTAPLPCFVLKK